jgi:hypothetical protein
VLVIGVAIYAGSLSGLGLAAQAASPTWRRRDSRRARLRAKTQYYSPEQEVDRRGLRRKANSAGPVKWRESGDRPRHFKYFVYTISVLKLPAGLRNRVLLLARNRALARLLVVPWLIAWVLTIPLFHIHALDLLEDRLLSQTVFAHTVLTPDLPGEYVPPTAAHQSGTQQEVWSHSPHYSEFALALFSEEEEDSKRKIGIQPILSVQFFSLSQSSLSSLRNAIPHIASPLVVLRASIFPRAPPVISC